MPLNDKVAMSAILILDPQWLIAHNCDVNVSLILIVTHDGPASFTSGLTEQYCVATTLMINWTGTILIGALLDELAKSST